VVMRARTITANPQAAMIHHPAGQRGTHRHREQAFWLAGMAACRALVWLRTRQPVS
jgi:hypothetical protein